NEIYNRYDVTDQRWTRLLDTPLMNGHGKMNAYMDGPILGADGYYHLCWVWRDTPDCATNHDLSYARSKDLFHWENAAGEAVTLPISLQTPGVIIDPIPVGGGIINGCNRLGFDADGRVVITYHKFDANGNTQVYAARYEYGIWTIRQISNWAYRWYFSGGGTIPNEIRLGTLLMESGKVLSLPFQHSQYGRGVLRIDAETLAPLGVADALIRYPSALTMPTSPFPGMQVQWVEDEGEVRTAGVRYALRWETLPAYFDKPRSGALPGSSPLVLYVLRDQ
ncbi:MAG TPA: BNR repeat-containing protein, partial [Armatimonadota bacterium]|nr:BNR repeat-containing protein [Armatimonadota bacterium]